MILNAISETSVIRCKMLPHIFIFIKNTNLKQKHTEVTQSTNVILDNSVGYLQRHCYVDYSTVCVLCGCTIKFMGYNINQKEEQATTKEESV